MIFDEQPQMMDAANAYTHEERWGRAVLEVAFAAIDREALIEKATTALVIYMDVAIDKRRGIAEDILIAAGIIPRQPS